MTSSPSDYTASLPTKRMGAAVLFADSAGRALLVEPTYKDYWELPGGCVDARESPRGAAEREVKEELSLVVQPGPLLVVDWVPPRPSRTEGVMFVFDGGSLDTRSIKLPPDELRSWAWCDASEAAERMSELLARRTAAAIDALREGTTAYLENGTRVG